MLETLAFLAHGFSVAFTPQNLLWCLVGCTLGTAVGVLPGVGPALTIALLLLAFTTVSSVLGASALRGFASLFVGLAVGLIGIDAISAQQRFTLGVPELLDGIDVVIVAVGLFAVGETLYLGIYQSHAVET